MKTLKTNTTSLAIAVIFSLVACTENNESKEVSTPPPQPSSKTDEAVNIKLDSLLSRLVNNSEKSVAIDPEKISAQLSINNQMVEIEVTYDQEQVSAENIKFFKELGGQVETVFQNKLYGWLPINKIRLAAQPEKVWSLSAATQMAYPVDKPTAKK